MRSASSWGKQLLRMAESNEGLAHKHAFIKKPCMGSTYVYID
mgnify:CR=1 FL=1